MLPLVDLVIAGSVLLGVGVIGAAFAVFIIVKALRAIQGQRK